MFTYSYSKGLFNIVSRVITSVKYAGHRKFKRCVLKAKTSQYNAHAAWGSSVHCCFILHVLHLINHGLPLSIWLSFSFTVVMLMLGYYKTQNLYFSTSPLKTRCWKNSWWNCRQVRIHRITMCRLNAEVKTMTSYQVAHWISSEFSNSVLDVVSLSMIANISIFFQWVKP